MNKLNAIARKANDSLAFNTIARISVYGLMFEVTLFIAFVFGYELAKLGIITVNLDIVEALAIQLINELQAIDMLHVSYAITQISNTLWLTIITIAFAKNI